ncbi:hypothetical protein B6Q10_27585 [Escherichia coli]|nr:hypothetical protein [Escherichia coli]EFN6838588.1 hypothetical protein [Escherichia coli H4]EEW1564949.1 hypothetical protein [Escherichia coli]EEW1638282.1 hypothetical protein [Escherichia coli]EEW2075345.1 hypothetical protein [Escherichia coli]
MRKIGRSLAKDIIICSTVSAFDIQVFPKLIFSTSKSPSSPNIPLMLAYPDTYDEQPAFNK